MFREVVSQAITYASSKPLGQAYTILVIFTDGQFNDLQEIRSLLLPGSTTPLSILIIGIGNQDFSRAELLDNDFYDNEHRGKMERPERDMVSFVKFERF